VLIDLHTATRGTIHLAVLDGGHVLYLEKIAGEANVHSHSAVGGRLPASCTATGKVLLALSENGQAQLDLLRAEELPQLTSRTVTSLGDLHRQLAQIRGRGFAVEVEETMPQYGSIAVPVVSSDGRVLAAISVTESSSRLTVRRLLPELRSAAATAARAIDRALLAYADGELSPLGRAPGPRAGAAAAGPSPARLPCALPSHTARAAG
jgi:DNA-binding IclR family transcriptional regulator